MVLPVRLASCFLPLWAGEAYQDRAEGLSVSARASRVQRNCRANTLPPLNGPPIYALPPTMHPRSQRKQVELAVLSSCPLCGPLDPWPQEPEPLLWLTSPLLNRVAPKPSFPSFAPSSPLFLSSTGSCLVRESHSIENQDYPGPAPLRDSVK